MVIIIEVMSTFIIKTEFVYSQLICKSKNSEYVFLHIFNTFFIDNYQKKMCFQQIIIDRKRIETV